MENTASNSSFIFACVFVAAGICFLSRCLVLVVSFGSTALAFKLHVTLLSEVVREHRQQDGLKVSRGSVFHSVSQSVAWLRGNSSCNSTVR
jgi:hypothetical protein